MSDKGSKSKDLGAGRGYDNSSVAERAVSSEEMSDVRKDMIRFALDHNILDIRSYAGYKGDLLVEITTLDIELLPILKAHAQSLGMQTVLQQKSNTNIYEIYCITPNEELYHLKEMIKESKPVD